MFGLEHILGKKETLSDEQLIKTGSLFESYAAELPTWNSAKDVLVHAQKRFGKIAKKEKRQERLVAHADLARNLSFPRVNNFEMEDQFDYARRIYIKTGSNDGLYSLGQQAMNSAKGFNTDLKALQFLEYARDIFDRLDKRKDLLLLGHQALIMFHTRYRNPVSEERFLEFTIDTWKKGNMAKEDIISRKDRLGEVRDYNIGTLFSGIEPHYS